MPQVTQTVVEPVMALLPELDFIRLDTKASPVLGARRVASRIPRHYFGVGCFQLLTRTDHATLAGRDCRKAAAHGPGREVSAGFAGGKFRHPAGNPDLSVELPPIEHQSGPPIGPQFETLAAIVVREKDESSRINALEENHSNGRVRTGRCGSQRHSVRLDDAGSLSGPKPTTELTDGIGVKSFLS